MEGYVKIAKDCYLSTTSLHLFSFCFFTLQSLTLFSSCFLSYLLLSSLKGISYLPLRQQLAYTHTFMHTLTNTHTHAHTLDVDMRWFILLCSFIFRPITLLLFLSFCLCLSCSLFPILSILPSLSKHCLQFSTPQSVFADSFKCLFYLQYWCPPPVQRHPGQIDCSSSVL